jgi:hypothetical protein
MASLPVKKILEPGASFNASVRAIKSLSHYILDMLGEKSPNNPIFFFVLGMPSAFPARKEKRGV